MTEFKRVEPGDLITADLMNIVLGELTALGGRVTKLEDIIPGSTPQGGQPVLTRREPTGDVPVLLLLTLIGRNFSPISGTKVHLGSATITQFSEASDTRLSFQVPNVFVGLPRTVNVTVETLNGTSSPLSVRLQPPEDLQDGEVVVEDKTGDLAEIEEGKTYTLAWRVSSDTLQPATYDLSLVITSVEPAELADAWAENATLSTVQEKIAAGDPLDVTADVTVPTGAETATFALRAASVGGQFVRTSSVTTLTVGEMVEGSDERLVLTVPDQPPGNDAGTGFNSVQLVDGTIEVDYGATGSILVKIKPTISEAGRYQFSRTIENAGSPARWTSPNVAPTELVIEAGQEGDVKYGVRNLGTEADPPPDAVFVARAAKRNAANTADEYVSFIRIPIRGANVI